VQRITRLYTDEHGRSRFDEIEAPFVPEHPATNEMGVSQPWQSSAVLLGQVPAGGSHPEQPEHRRQLVIGISGTAEVIASGESRIFGPGDVLLVEDTEGVGHSSRSSDGFVAAFVLLEPTHVDTDGNPRS
jgi:quercetin dioxygenase-like cupin family protein